MNALIFLDDLFITVSLENIAEYEIYDSVAYQVPQIRIIIVDDSMLRAGKENSLPQA